MPLIADQSKGTLGDEVPVAATPRWRRATAQFAGLPITQAALRFASARHAGQYREIDHAPFIAHPIEVGSLLRRDGQPDETIAAGLLHDVLEKTATTSADCAAGSEPGSRCSSSRSQTIQRSSITSPASASCATG
jgi:HD domain